MELSTIWIALSSIIFSASLFWPGESFYNPEYNIMKMFASELIWAFAFLINGSVTIWSLLTGIKSKYLFMFDSVGATILWTITSLSILLSVYPPPADCAPPLVFAFMSWWIMVRYEIPHDCDINKKAVK